jgi:protein ImuA
MDLLPAAVLSPVPVPAPARGEQTLRPESLSPRISPEALHPSLWLGHQLGRHAQNALASGFAALDAQLPGGGWPRRVLTEMMLPHPGVGEIRLLAPSLVATQNAGRLVMLFDPPAALSPWALVPLGFDVEQLLVIDTRTPAVPGADRIRAHEVAALDGRLWALEQALKSGHVGALVAWLPPRLRGERLRRLQLAAQAHDGPAFMLREMAAQQRPSAAPLRLALRAGGADVLALRLLKRRGPPLEAPLLLALPPVLSGVARQRALAGVQDGALNRPPETVGETVGETADGKAGLRAATFVNLA